LKITIECEKPKYVKDTYHYQGLEDVYKFLLSIRGFPKGLIGHWLLNIAKEGFITPVRTARYDIGIDSDFHNYAFAEKMAKEVGLVYSFDIVSPKLEKALAFAQAFDEEVNKRV
jgi:hypothetical protein